MYRRIDVDVITIRCMTGKQGVHMMKSEERERVRVRERAKRGWNNKERGISP